MKNQSYIGAFLKYSKLEYLQQIQRGKLYCNPIQYFANCNPKNGVGDQYENIVKQTFEKSAVLEMFKGDHLITHINIMKHSEDYCQATYTNENFKANLFCLFTLDFKNFESDTVVTLPTELKMMGSHALIIDSIQFIERCKKALIDRNLEFAMNKVNYIDFKDFHGRKSYFDKPIEYSYQNEYRIMIKNTIEAPFTLDIGSIEDISMIIPASCKTVRLKPTVF